ncbi:PREDICTED: protein PELOTA 1-like [Prunus mume]|uniref:Protein PELOTA 1-like n=1 Tax=Prunus mume TaxID=102107 RepID=A0ABM0PLR8_PRUMU|nr:PREDICTED: protein PELOTA 1-like [Prunus mume]
MKEDFRRFLIGEEQRLKFKSIVENNKSRIVVNTSKGDNNNCSSSLHEVLHDNAVMNLIKDTKAAMEIRAYKEFSDMVLSNSDRACYGVKSVEMAHELMAIETLLIMDDLFESAEIGTRHKYVGLVKSVKGAGGKAIVFSAKHVTGVELATTSIAAILRFPMPDLDDGFVT